MNFSYSNYNIYFLRIWQTIFLTCALFGFKNSAKAQTNIASANVKIEIDGILNEEVWKKKSEIINFKNTFPVDTGFAINQTQVWITYDEENFYIAAKCFHSGKDNLVVQSLKRDYSFPITEAFAVFFDPFNDKTNGYSFSVNPYGSQREGELNAGGSFGVTTAWDQAWHSAVSIKEEYWIAEMAIPFKSIRYNEKQDFWGINFARNDLANNQTSTWSAVPKGFNVANMAFNQKMIWDNAPKKSKNLGILIPYYTIGATQIAATEKLQTNNKIGLDAKIPISSSLNLDVTINPDFSQVEVDQQITNLSRFSLFLPEKRNFFLENANFFSSLGNSINNPFFSRRIGLSSGNAIPINYGLRLSGKIDENWRIGALNIEAQADENLDVPKSNYSLAILERKVAARSFVTIYGINHLTNSDFTESNFNRIYGGNFVFRNLNDNWYIKTVFSQAFTNETSEKNVLASNFIRYQTRKVEAGLFLLSTGDNYIAENGFNPRMFNFDAVLQQTFRLGYKLIQPNFKYYFYPKSNSIFRHGPDFSLERYLNTDNSLNENVIKLAYQFQFKNGMRISYTSAINKINLQFNTDLLRTGENQPLPPGVYDFQQNSLRILTDRRKKLYVASTFNFGAFYNGNRTGINLETTFRANKKLNFAVEYNLNEITFDAPFGNRIINQFGLKNTISFTPTLYLNNYFQYNSQSDVVLFNSRFQWRFKPMSDLFLVYTDAYSSGFNSQTRAFVLKMNYWFGI